MADEDHKKHGKIVKRIVGNNLAILVADPDMNDLLIKKAYRLFDKTGTNISDSFHAMLGSYGLFAAPQSEWKD